MKKLIATLLLVAMVISVWGCGADQESETTAAPTTEPAPTTEQDVIDALSNQAKEAMAAVSEFSVGYARIDITPQKSVPMAGFGKTSNRMSRNILDNLYGTAIAMSDGQGTTLVFLTMDLQRASDITVEHVRLVLSEQIGIPQEHIILSGTHTHSGPDLNNTSEPHLVEYIDYLNPRLVQVCKEAIIDMKPAEMYIGSAETESLNFVKHYEHTTADGTVKYFGDNFGSTVIDETTKHTTEADPTIHLLQFTREGEKDIIIANWRAHPILTGSSTKYDISADYPGAFRLAMETQLDCQFAYFQGAAGNMNPHSRIDSEEVADDVNEHGALLAQYAMEGLENMTKVETGTIQTRQTVLDMEVNHDTDSMYYKAKEIQSMWTSGASYSEVAAYGAPYGIRSPYMAGAIISRSNMPATRDVELDAIVIGDSVSIVTAPNELFDTNSVYVEEHSPYAMTMTFGYTNGYRGYIPSAYGWEYTSYESDCCYFKPGCGEVIQDTFLDMLNDIAG